MERWKYIDYNNRYKISNKGNVKSCKHSIKMPYGGVRKSPSKLMKQGLSKKGYYVVRLSNGGKSKLCVVHRLVAKAFIPNPLNKPQVNHIDGNKLNNNDWNLEWNTCKENVNHYFKNYYEHTCSQ